MDMFDLSGRVAIVSGTASGMGQAMATVFAEAGADLVLLDVNTAGNEATAHTLTHMGRRAIPIPADVSSYEDVDRVYALLDKEFGRVDILGNVAGNGIQKAAEEITMDEFVAVFQSLLFGRYYSTQQAGRRMLRQGRGSIMSIGSISGVSSLARQQSTYGMAMASVIHMTKELSTEWSGRGVRVNAVNPGVVRTALHRRGGMDEERYAAFVEHSRGTHPLGRVGTPEEVAAAILYLASDEAAWMTGVTLPVDGGRQLTCAR
jgi:NAD(P)-dependent dehydrogenase (short-subunit alcohol dehydrogenase family)